MSSQYVDFMTQNPLFQQMLRERETKGKIELILQLLHTHFSEATAELVELALRKVDIRDAEVIEPLKAVRSCFSAVLVEFTKRLDQIQDTEVLEEIEKAAVAHDIQRVLTLVKENDPTE